MNQRIAVLPVVWLFLLIPANFATAQEKVRVAISNFSASYISMHIAQKRGYYAEEGMIFEVILMAGLTSTRALIGNSVEFGSASNPTATVKGQRLYLTNRQEGVTEIMEFTRHKDRELMSRVYDDQ